MGGKFTLSRKIPNFSGIVKTIYEYDMAFDAKFRDRLTTRDETTGQEILTAFLFPHTQQDLRKMRDFFQIWADSSLGLLGRSPDVVWLLVLGIYSIV
jgi:aromatic ring hydroxylase